MRREASRGPTGFSCGTVWAFRVQVKGKVRRLLPCSVGFLECAGQQGDSQAASVKSGTGAVLTSRFGDCPVLEAGLQKAHGERTWSTACVDFRMSCTKVSLHFSSIFHKLSEVPCWEAGWGYFCCWGSCTVSRHPFSCLPPSSFRHTWETVSAAPRTWVPVSEFNILPFLSNRGKLAVSTESRGRGLPLPLAYMQTPGSESGSDTPGQGWTQVRAACSHSMVPRGPALQGRASVSHLSEGPSHVLKPPHYPLRCQGRWQLCSWARPHPRMCCRGACCSGSDEDFPRRARSGGPFPQLRH